MCQFFLICPSDKRGVAREQKVPEIQGPATVSKIFKNVLDLSQKMFVLLSEIMKPINIPKLRAAKELKVFENVK